MTATQLAPQHRDLTDINDVEPFTPEKDQPLFDDLKAVLTKHNAMSRFGISLLHRHFDVVGGEMLVEFCDTEKRTLTIKPLPDDQLPGDTYIETSWRFDITGANQACTLKCVGSGGRHNDTVHVSH
jgi:hypothetical protein